MEAETRTGICGLFKKGLKFGQPHNSTEKPKGKTQQRLLNKGKST